MKNICGEKHISGVCTATLQQMRDLSMLYYIIPVAVHCNVLQYNCHKKRSSSICVSMLLNK